MAEHLAKTHKDLLPSFLFWLIALLLLTPWVYIQSQMSVNSDVAWLGICAQRLLSGGSLLKDCYDTNPPLSILIYIPFVWVGNLLNLPVYGIIFWGTLLWIGLCAYLTHSILAPFSSLNTIEKRTLSLIYLCAVTIIPTIYYAERDHFLAIMLLPFILVQFSITHKNKTPYLATYFVLVIGSIALLLKPHFGLIPVVLFLHRIFVQKNFWVIKDKDFVILSGLSVAYILVVLTFFQGFANIILPDILQTYLHHNDPRTVYTTTIPYAALMLSCLIILPFLKDPSKPLLIVIAICALLSLLIYVMQMKGFTYHRLPLYALLFPLSGVLLLKIVEKPFKTKTTTTLLSYSFMLVIFVLSYLHSPLRPMYPKHTDYQHNQITQYIDEHCARPCSFYMTYENMDIVSQLAFYSGHTYATRFPTYWFLTALDTFSEEKKQAKEMQYAQYIAQDIERFSPSLIFILAESPSIGELQEHETLIGYFSFSPEFENVMAHYKKTDRLTVDRAYFYKGTPYDFPYRVTWDVYTKVSGE